MKLHLHGNDASKAHKRTREVRYTDARVAGWLSTTQVWTWHGGDAIVVVTGRLPRTQTYIVLRLKDKVHVVEGVGLNAALQAHGLDPKKFEVV